MKRRWRYMDQRDARGGANRDRSTQNHRRPVLLCATQRPTEKHKQRNNDHDETPRAARLPPNPSDGRPRGLGASLIERR